MPEPEIDGVCSEILSAYSAISRQRRYAGSHAVPLPISSAEIDAFLSSYQLLIDRDELDASIYALDEAFRSNWAEQQKKVFEEQKNKKNK